MYCRWGYRDIPPCDSCTPDEEGVWLEGFNSFKKRADRYDNFTGLITALLVDFDSSLESDSDTENEGLAKLVNGRATLSIKEVTVCDGPKEKLGGTRGRYKYPAFPLSHLNQWDGIQNSKWDAVSRYWGNSSASYSNWGVGKLQPADTVTVPGMGSVRAPYQSK